MWELNNKESWAPKELMLWNCGAGRRLLRVPWTARRSNQPILKEISPEYSLEGLMLKLKLPIFWPCEELTHLKRPWYWERLKVGGEGDDRGWDGWMTSPTQWTRVWVNLGVGDGQGGLVCCGPWCHKESDTIEQLNWSKLMTPKEWGLCLSTKKALLTLPKGLILYLS